MFYNMQQSTNLLIRSMFNQCDAHLSESKNKPVFEVVEMFTGHNLQFCTRDFKRGFSEGQTTAVTSGNVSFSPGMALGF